MQFASIGSGSKGNSLVIRSATTAILVDNGFTLKTLTARLATLGMSPEDISAVIVTHEHSDHVNGVGPLVRKFEIPVYLSHGTHAKLRDDRFPVKHYVCYGETFRIGDIDVFPYPVPHDAREPVQYVFSSNGKRLGILTDAGSITPHMVEVLSGLDAMLLEFNHDVDMLRDGPYPPALQWRVGGKLGHLNNAQSMSLLNAIDVSKLQTLVAGHISEQNNCKNLVSDMLAGLDQLQHVETLVASQDAGFPWRVVE